MAGKDVATKNNTSVAMAAGAELFSQVSGAGLENVSAKDILVPRVTILQGLSPQVTRGKPEYDEEAKVGQIYDVGLGEIIGDSMIVVPILYRMQWLQWAPRNSGKGLQGIHDTDEILARCKQDDKGRDVLDNGDYIQETAQFYVLNLSKGARLSFLPMASTQLKKARKWLTWATGEKLQGPQGEFTPPLFYRSYVLSTVPESNNEGNWMGWKIDRGAALPDMEGWEDLFKTLNETHKMISEGKARGDIESMANENQGNQASDSSRM